MLPAPNALLACNLTTKGAGDGFIIEATWHCAETYSGETATALQVILVSGSFELGAYETEKYYDNWRKV